MNYIIAIDPGNQQSAFCIMDGDTLKPLRFAKLDNEPMFCEMVEGIAEYCCIPENTVFAIEWIKSYGNAVGDSVFETCAWIGRLEERLKDYKVTRIIRAWEKTQICHSSRANDSNIRRALIDRFAKDVRNDGKGTKAEPGWFYGFRRDVWQAYAVGVTYHDMFYEGTITTFRPKPKEKREIQKQFVVTQTAYDSVQKWAELNKTSFNEALIFVIKSGNKKVISAKRDKPSEPKTRRVISLVTPSLDEEMSQKAKAQGVSLNEYVCFLMENLTDFVGNKKKGD